MAKHWTDWSQMMRDREQQAAVRQMLAQAWNEGYEARRQECLSGHHAPSAANPYEVRSSPGQVTP